MNKADLRKFLRTRLHTLSEASRTAASKEICQRLCTLPHFQSADTVLLFAPQHIEPDIDLLWTRPEVRKKRLLYPRVHDSGLLLYEVRDPDELLEGRWKLREPTVSEKRIVAPAAVNFIVVPGIAFSHKNERLGRGGGYYDRLLSGTPDACKAGVCFDFQLYKTLPVESHDVAVDAVITGSTIVSPL